MIDAKRAEKLIEGGMAATCAWCDRLWESYDRTGNPSCQEDCGGPSSGRGFPRYKGPWGSNKSGFCFRCAGKPCSVAEFSGRSGSYDLVGICEDHIDLFKEIVESRKNIIVREKKMSILDCFNSVEAS